ncbi:MAG: leucyl aminopeptidase [Nitrospinota bacterium]|nr:leucyl aminopeptidase [Nitrospinota bacterium]
MIKTTIKLEDVLNHKTDCLVVPCVEEKTSVGTLREIDQCLDGVVSQSIMEKRFEGKLNQNMLLNARGTLNADYILLVGAGKAKAVTEEKIRQAAGVAARLAEKSRFKKVTFLLADDKLAKSMQSGRKGGYYNLTLSMAEGIYLSLYHFDHYKENKKDDKPGRVEAITFLADSKACVTQGEKAIDRARKVASGVALARDLALHPSNIATPEFLAATARKMAAKNGIACKVLGEKEMKKLGMGSLLGVAQGSSRSPRFIILEYFGSKKKQPPAVIVGKGITFDTGGISLKPPAGMWEMKMDMCGGAVTLGVLQAASSLKLPVNLVGLVPAVENMPGGSAVNPGDVLYSMSGKTIEVLNTDAEGRLILADALTYASRYKPKAVIDLATLTGACVVALGHHASAILGNDSRLVDRLIQCGMMAGEKVWELPLWEEYEETMKSDIADLKNISAPTVGAGTITGAAFLKSFAGNQPWAHIDIAGTSWCKEDRPYIPKGATGFGVRLLLNYLEN